MEFDLLPYWRCPRGSAITVVVPTRDCAFAATPARRTRRIAPRGPRRSVGPRVASRFREAGAIRLRRAGDVHHAAFETPKLSDHAERFPAAARIPGTVMGDPAGDAPWSGAPGWTAAPGVQARPRGPPARSAVERSSGAREPCGTRFAVGGRLPRQVAFSGFPCPSGGMPPTVERTPNYRTSPLAGEVSSVSPSPSRRTGARPGNSTVSSSRPPIASI